VTEFIITIGEIAKTAAALTSIIAQWIGGELSAEQARQQAVQRMQDARDLLDAVPARQAARQADLDAAVPRTPSA